MTAKLISIFITCAIAGGCAGAAGTAASLGPDAGPHTAPGATATADAAATAGAAARPDAACPANVGIRYRVTASGTVVDFVSGAAHDGSVGVELGSWYATPPFCAEWSLFVQGGEFNQTVTLRALLGVPILVARTGGVGPLAQVLSDQTATCQDRTCAIVHFTVPVLPTRVEQSWRTDLAAGGMADAATRGLILYEFRESDGTPAPGVAPMLAPLFGDARRLLPGSEVRFLASDRRSLLPADTGVTGRSGVAIIALGQQLAFITGDRSGVRWSSAGVVDVPGQIFVEDARP